jgi:hypothetical protein
MRHAVVVVVVLFVAACEPAPDSRPSVVAQTLYGSSSPGPTAPMSALPSVPLGAASPAALGASAAGCQVLPKPYCEQGRVTTLDNNGAAAMFLVFALPRGVPIRSPVRGRLDKTRGSGNVTGFVGIVRGTPALLVQGDIVFDNLQSRDVEIGDQIAVSGDTQTHIGIDVDFNLALTFTVRSSAGAVVDETSLRAFFPDAFARSTITFRQLPPGAPVVFIDNGATPPVGSSPP